MVRFVIKSKKYGEKICTFDESDYDLVGVSCVVYSTESKYILCTH